MIMMIPIQDDYDDRYFSDSKMIPSFAQRASMVFPFTQVVEYKPMLNQKSQHIALFKECPADVGEPTSAEGYLLPHSGIIRALKEGALSMG